MATPFRQNDPELQYEEFGEMAAWRRPSDGVDAFQWASEREPPNAYRVGSMHSACRWARPDRLGARWPDGTRYQCRAPRSASVTLCPSDRRGPGIEVGVEPHPILPPPTHSCRPNADNS